MHLWFQATLNKSAAFAALLLSFLLQCSPLLLGQRFALRISFRDGFRLSVSLDGCIPVLCVSLHSDAIILSGPTIAEGHDHQLAAA